MMVKFTLSDLVAFLAGETFLFAALPVIAVVCTFFLVPGLQRRPLWRRVAIGLDAKWHAAQCSRSR